jgi:hypothetical protein
MSSGKVFAEIIISFLNHALDLAVALGKIA